MRPCHLSRATHRESARWLSASPSRSRNPFGPPRRRLCHRRHSSALSRDAECKNYAMPSIYHSSKAHLGDKRVLKVPKTLTSSVLETIDEWQNGFVVRKQCCAEQVGSVLTSDRANELAYGVQRQYDRARIPRVQCRYATPHKRHRISKMPFLPSSLTWRTSALTLDRLDEFTHDRDAVCAAHLYESHHTLPCKHRLGESRLSQTVEKQRQVVMQVEALRFDEPSNRRLRMPMVNADREITAPVSP